jgi:UDP-N-acetylmuramoyl-tripeptide--D-alanyl-D-alanine ligase
MPCQLTLEELAKATGGTIVKAAAPSNGAALGALAFREVNTDSRVEKKASLFVPLVGDRYDGHDFVAQAVTNGATAILASREISTTVSVVRVQDTLKALQDLAHYWRRQLRGRVVGITGSNGKSTTKDFAATILKNHFRVTVSQKSFNNHIGVPLTLLSADREAEIVLLEMGMNHAGELTALSKIAEPDIVVCTMVGRAHIGNFGGSQQGVADAKHEIYIANPGAKKIFNYDNEYTLAMFEHTTKTQGTENTLVFSSFSAGAEVSLRATRLSFDGLHVTGHIGGVKGEADVPAFGRQNVVSLMAAATIAYVFGLEPETIWREFRNCRTGWGRNQLVKVEGGPTVLFDAYNANPDSMAALIKNFYEMNVHEGGRKVAVLGEMLELGELAPAAHRELGEMVGNTDFDVVCFVGPSAKDFHEGIKASGFSKTSVVSNTYEEVLAKKLRDMLRPSDVVIMKASRGVQLERMLKIWQPNF